ncbi:MAG: flagellar basal body P-ring protein FlgI [Alphaproteobacteria bacterium]|jgi:flagellar P-ring protein precursor FlgI
MLLRATILFLLILPCINYALADSRIKDIVYFEGIRENVLVGYGLVVGLNGSGDNLKNSAFTEKGLTDFLERLGVNTRGANLKTKNIAAVMITATLPPFGRTGSRMSVDISTIGDAKSLKGGTLLATPLLGADGEVYAVAQGPVSIGSKPSDDNDKPDTMSPTAGFINNGAIIEREINFDLSSLKELNLALKNPDITTARSIETAINSAIREKIAFAKDPGTIEIKVPDRYGKNVMGLLSDIEGINIYPDNIARIVIDEATGTIVIGDKVSISKVAVAQGNLVVKVDPEADFLFEIGATKKSVTSPRGSEIALLKETTELNDVVQGLNSLGVKPKDLVAILKTIKQAGALHAEIVTK